MLKEPLISPYVKLVNWRLMVTDKIQINCLTINVKRSRWSPPPHLPPDLHLPQPLSQGMCGCPSPSSSPSSPPINSTSSSQPSNQSINFHLMSARRPPHLQTGAWTWPIFLPHHLLLLTIGGFLVQKLHEHIYETLIAMTCHCLPSSLLSWW